MKHLFAILVSFCVLTGAAQAQNYRPFRAGLSYQLNETTAPGDTTHLLRLTAARRVGTDSVFSFNQRASRSIRVPNNCPGRYVSRPDNLFGTTLTVRPGAEYVLTAANGRALVLRPRQAVGQSWAAASGLTATVSSRTLGAVLGRPDSLVSISLSDGATLTLSKSFGWVAGPALGSYLSPRLPRKALALTALPELRLGPAKIGALVAYDFQPGDVFLTYAYSYGFGPCARYDWIRDSVLSRTSSRTGDTVTYQIRTRTLNRLCASGLGTLSAPSTRTLVVTPGYQQLNYPTAAWDGAAPAGQRRAGWLHQTSYRSADYNGRPVQWHWRHADCGGQTAPADTTVLYDTGSLDAGIHLQTAPGLGSVRTAEISFSGGTTTLIGYRKGTETWGQLTTFAQLLPAASARPTATTAAFPSPFGSELSVKFQLARPQPVGLELRDALGRLVLSPPPAALPAGGQTVPLATAGLPAGFYTVHLLLPDEKRTEVLKVLKAE